MSFDSQSFFDNYLSTASEETPIQALGSQIDAFLSSSAYSYIDYDEDVLVEKNFQSHYFEFLPNTLPYSVVEEFSSGSTFSADLTHEMSFIVTDASDTTILSHTVNLADIANKQLILGFEAATSTDQAVIDQYGSVYTTPPYLIEIKPVLRVNGVSIAEGTAIQAASSLIFTTNFLAPRRNLGSSITQNTIDNIDLSIRAGNDVAIALNTDKIVLPEVSDEEMNTTEFWGDQKLYRTALNYLKRVEENQIELGNIFGGTYTNEATRAFVFNGTTVTTVAGVPQGFEWKGLRLDSSSVINYASYFGDIDTHKKEFDMLFGLASSLDESSIFEEDFEIEAMSTVKGLKLINDGAIPGVDMVKINTTNLTDLNALDISESLKSTMRTSIEDGYTIYTPTSDFTYMEWTGLVYITLDPENGDGGYTIGEGLNGGYTVEDWGFFGFAINNANEIRAEILLPSDGSSYERGDPVSYSVRYEADFNVNLIFYSYTYTYRWTESGTYGKEGLQEGTYYIRSGYGTNEYVTFYVTVDHTNFANNFDTSLLFPKCDSIDGSDAEFDYPCEDGRKQDGENFEEEMIVIHYTAGSSVQEAYNKWIRLKDRSAHFIVDRDGSIYEIIDPEDEAYHVARDSQFVNSRSIGIEIVNQGYSRWSTWFDDSEYYPWNDYDTWQVYTDVQYQAVKELVQYLTGKYGIPEVLFHGDVEHGPIDYVDENVAGFEGIVGHSALDADKRDPGPLFDFNNLFSE